MINSKIYEHQENYTCQIIKLPSLTKIEGLDNLVEVCIQGNKCLVGKNTDVNVLHLFFGPETVLSPAFLKSNNLYRHSELNQDPTQKGFFEDNGRVRSIKFRGIISSGFVIPVTALQGFIEVDVLTEGMEFNEINGHEICRKFIKKIQHVPGEKGSKLAKIIDKVVDDKMAPEHPDTQQFCKSLHLINPSDRVVCSYKKHGTSIRVYNNLTYRKLSRFEKLLKWLGFKIQEQEYNYIVGSRRVIKSIGYNELPGKEHYYGDDLYTKAAKEFIGNNLYESEAVYAEIIGTDYNGKPIQKGYTYGLNKLKLYVYRISNINPQGIEVDLSYDQMKERASILGLEVVPEFFVGDWWDFVRKYSDQNIKPEEKVRSYFPTDNDIKEEIKNIFYNKLLDQPDPEDKTCVNEGFVIRTEKYPKPLLLKVKSPLFLLHETKILDENKEILE